MQNASTMQHDRVRKYERRPYSEVIAYSLSVQEEKNKKWLDLKGKAVNVCEAGVCIETDYPLAPGHMLWINSGLEEKAGFVRWSQEFEAGYRAGVELDGKHIQTLDEATEIFNKRLEEIEKLSENPDQSADEMVKLITETVNDVLQACRLFEITVEDKEIVKDAQIRFREKTNSLLSKSYFVNRARTWPQGYQGDYKMLEVMYRNTPLSDGIGNYLDLYSLNLPLAIAVRNRIKKLEDILRDELLKRQNPSVLNIACGSCREVFELASDIEKTGAKITCIDLDNDALAFTANRLSYTNISPLSSNQVVLRKYNAVRMFDHELNMQEFGRQDIIYSVGFFDYLESDFLSRLFKSLYNLLTPGGLLITSFKDAARYSHQEYHWCVDWDGFLQRTETDFKDIFKNAGISGSSITELREESGVIVFYLVRK
jgi:extracellular factor (EF) 3-hydroxypalmitic acid methyl ester biosynthesis protein